MKFSARNALTGRIIDIKNGAVSSVVTVDIGGGNYIVSSITIDALRELELEVGKEVATIIKASNVMLAVA